jgi:hypothetical protein
MDKEVLVENVNNWVDLDKQILKLQSDVRELKKKKGAITDILVEVMRKNNVDSFDMKEDSLLYKKQTIKQPINKKLLLESLQNFYKTDTNTVEKIIDHIMDQRKTTIKETIKRKGQN